MQYREERPGLTGTVDRGKKAARWLRAALGNRLCKIIITHDPLQNQLLSTIWPTTSLPRPWTYAGCFGKSPIGGS